MVDASGVARAFTFHNSVAGRTKSIGVYVGRNSTAHSLIAALYAGPKGHPSRRLAKGVQRSLRRGEWNVVHINRVRVRANQTYWIAFLALRGHVSLRVRRGGCKNERSEATLGVAIRPVEEGTA